MNSKVPYLLAALWLIGCGFAVSIDVVPEYPPLIPGDSNALLVTVSSETAIENVEIKLHSDQISIEKDNTWIELGDTAGGTLSKSVNVAIPSDIEQGIIYVDAELRYDSNSKTYVSHIKVPLMIGENRTFEIIPIGKPIGNKLQKLKFIVQNNGGNAKNVIIQLSGALSPQEFYIGELKSGESKEIFFNVVPVCNNGIATFNFHISYYIGNKRVNLEKAVTDTCVVASSGIDVKTDLSSFITEGIHNITIEITNTKNIAIGNVIVMVSSEGADLSGEVEKYIDSIGPNETISIPLKMDVKDDSKVVTLRVNVFEGQLKKEFAFTSIVRKRPSLILYIADTPEIEGNIVKVTIGAANTGNDDIKNLIISLKGIESQFIGSLSAGDYDSASFSVPYTGRDRDLNITVIATYTYKGEEYKVEKGFEIEIPKKGGFNGWIIGLLILIGGWYLWKRNKSAPVE